MSHAPLTGLDGQLQGLVEREIQPGERIVWAQQPLLRWFTVEAIGAVIAGILLTGVVGAAATSAVRSGQFRTGGEVVKLVVLSGLFALGGLLLMTPYRSRQAAQRTV